MINHKKWQRGGVLKISCLIIGAICILALGSYWLVHSIFPEEPAYDYSDELSLLKANGFTPTNYYEFNQELKNNDGQLLSYKWKFDKNIDANIINKFSSIGYTSTDSCLQKKGHYGFRTLRFQGDVVLLEFTHRYE